MADYTQFNLRGDTKSNWLNANPVLSDREIALETDTQRFKIGNGTSYYNQLPYGRNTGEYLNFYNVTALAHITAGNYYTHETAILAVPSSERTKGTIVSYETASGVWYTERFIGSNVSNWSVLANWEKVPDAGDIAQLRSDLNEVNEAVESNHIEFNIDNIFSIDGYYRDNSNVMVANVSLKTTPLIPINSLIDLSNRGIEIKTGQFKCDSSPVRSVALFFDKSKTLISTYADYAVYNVDRPFPYDEIPNNAYYVAFNAYESTLPVIINNYGFNGLKSKLTDLSEISTALDNVVFGQWSGSTNSQIEEFFNVDLRAGFFSFNIKAGNANVYVDINLYDSDGILIANPTGTNSLYIQANSTVTKTATLGKDVKKIGLKCVTSGSFTVDIINDSSLVNLLPIKEMTKAVFPNCLGNKELSLNGVGIYEEYINLNKGVINCKLSANVNAYARIELLSDDGTILATTGDTYIIGGNITKKTLITTSPVYKMRITRITSAEFAFKIESDNTFLKSFYDNSIKQIINKSASKNIIYVKKVGGDFYSIQGAINSIKDASIHNQYEIRVCDDDYIINPLDLWLVSSPTTKNTNINPTEPCAYIITKDYVDIVGYNRLRTISVKMPYSLAGTSFQYVQTLFLQGNCNIENMCFELKNGRYAIHQESGGNPLSLDYNAITRLKNCVARHLGNSDSADGGVSWPSICGQANGTCAGLKLEYDNVTWIPTFYIHNNPNFNSPTYFRFKNCSIIPNLSNLASGFQGGYIESYGCGHNYTADIQGCNFLGMDLKIGVSSSNILTDPCHDIRTMIPSINGYGNANSLVCRQVYSSYVLCFETLSNNQTVKVLSGSAKIDIFGEDLLSFDGTNDAHGFVAGTEYVKDYAFTLGKRLGDCTGVNKTLIIKVGGVEQTVTFNTNYTNMSNANVITAINTQLTGVIATMSSKDNSMIMYPFKDCYEVGFNYSTSTILSGMPLIRDIGNPLGWKICPVGTKAEAMSCERINPNDSGKIAILKKNVFKSFRDIAIGTSHYAKVYASGYWTAAASREEADLIEIAAGCWTGI